MNASRAFFTHRSAAAFLLVLGSTVASAQAPAPSKPADTARSHASADGHPDFSGTWERYVPPRDPNAPRNNTPGAGLGPGFAGPPPPLKPEFTAAYDADFKRRADAEARGEPILRPNAACIPEGMPSMMVAQFPMEVLQTRGQVTIIQEAFNQVRRIYVGEDPPAVADAEPGFFGHSGAKWEGETLVVDTVGIKENVRNRNVPHSDQMRIHERMRFVDADRFEDQITVTDSAYLTGPWSWTWTYQRKPGYKMYEYVCEDNREYADPVTGEQKMKFKDKK